MRKIFTLWFVAFALMANAQTENVAVKLVSLYKSVGARYFMALGNFTDEFAGMDEECLDRLVLTDFE